MSGVDALEARLEDLTGQLDTLRGSVIELTERARDYDGLEEQLESLAVKVSGLADRLRNLESQVDNATPIGDHRDLEGRIYDLERRIDQ